MREDNETNKLILLILIIFGFIGLIFFLSKSVPSVLYTENQIRSTLDEVSLTVPQANISVDLSEGSARFETENDNEEAITITAPYLAVKTTDGYDLYSVLRHDTSGLEEIVYIAIFEENEGEATFREAYKLGDRVVVSEMDGPDVEQEGPYFINVDYLAHEEFEPKTEPPTVERSINLDIENHQISTPAIEEEEEEN